MYRLGMRKIVADPGVQVAYQMQGLGFRRLLSHQSLFDDRKTFLSHPADKDRWKCCPLPEDGKQYIDWNQCRWQDMSAFFAKGLPYPAGQQEQYATHWNWETATGKVRNAPRPPSATGASELSATGAVQHFFPVS